MWIPQWLVFVAGAGLVALAVVLLFAAQYGGLRHAWDEFQEKQISFQNTTDTVLCFGDGGPPTIPCAREIKPLATSDWSPGTCTGGTTVTVYDPQTQTVLYSRSAECGGFDGVTIIINQRNGEFVIADSLPPPSAQASTGP